MPSNGHGTAVRSGTIIVAPGDATTNIERYREGWRSGKPVEDPDKLKRWGWITAKPSEYLVCTRRGQIDRRRSGQGARIFKWPWEAVSIVPTTLQRIEFVADQITREHVGVTVTGIAVYRIAEPELAYRVLNFTYGEAASEKLAQTLREMFIGAARRLIANLALEECLTRRKEAIASFLMSEIAPVVSGEGALEDTTDQGWGVVIDTIEIQDVQIQSGQVFAHLQAPYRAAIAARAELAEVERARQVAESRAEAQRRAEEANLRTAQETRTLRAKAEADASEAEAREAMRAEEAKARVAADDLARKEAYARRQIEVDQAVAMRRADGVAAVARRQAELDQDKALAAIKVAEEQRRARAEAEVAALAAELARADAAHEQAVRELEQGRARKSLAQAVELELKLRQTELELELGRRAAEARARDGEIDAVHQRRLAEVEQLVSQSRALRELVTVGLPQIAAAFQQSFGTIHYTQVGEGAGPLGMVAGAIQQIVAVARGMGLELPQPPPRPSGE
jgi:regulator of protease activity HflC (stomatin/prohibitin superfamily)